MVFFFSFLHFLSMAMFVSVLWCQYHCLSSNFSIDIFSLWRWTWLPLFFFSSSGYFKSIFATFNIILIVMYLKCSHVFVIYIPIYYIRCILLHIIAFRITHTHITQAKRRTKVFCALTGIGSIVYNSFMFTKVSFNPYPFSSIDR